MKKWIGAAVALLFFVGLLAFLLPILGWQKQLDQRTTVERGKLRKALGAEKPLKLHEIIPGFWIVFIFDVDAVKQTFVVVDSLFHNSICQKLKAPFGNKGLEGDDRQLCCIRFIQGRKSRRQVGGLSV